jgi:transcriptional regulator with XRE-family HTH domain
MTAEPSAAPEDPVRADTMRRMAGDGAAAKEGRPRLGPMEDEVPRRIRAERERRKISVRELARRLDVSPSAISQIETGRARPSVATLYAIVTELGMSLDELFDHDVTRRPVADDEGGLGRAVVRAAGRESLDLGTGVRWERMTRNADPNVDFIYVTYDVGGASSPDGQMMRHSGREYGVVLTGTLRVTVAFETRELGPGDSIWFESTSPHRLSNEGDEPVTAIWMVIGRHGSDPRTSGFSPASA